MRPNSYIFTLVIFSLFAIFSKTGFAATTSGWTSVATYNGNPAPQWSRGNAVAVQSNGDYWVGATYFGGVLTFGSTNLVASGNDLALVKFSAAGSVLLAIKFDSLTNIDVCEITAIGVDSTGSVTVQGYYNGGLIIGGVTLPSSSVNRLFVAKLTSTGAVVYATAAVVNNNVYVRDLVIDGAGNAIVTGSYTGTFSFAGTSLPSTSDRDGYVLKISPTGTVLATQVTSGSGARTTIPNSLVIAPNGDIYVGGSYFTTAKFGTVTLSCPAVSTSYCPFVAKLNSALAWQSASAPTVTGTAIAGEVLDLAINSAGNVYGTGRFSGTLTFGSKTITRASFDIFWAVFSSALVPTTASQGFTSDGKGTSLATDANGNVWAAGVAMGPSCNFTGFVFNSPNYNNYLGKLNSNAVFTTLLTSAVSTGSSQPYRIAIGSNNKIIDTGSASGTVNFDKKKITTTVESLYVAVYTI